LFDENQEVPDHDESEQGEGQSSEVEAENDEPRYPTRMRRNPSRFAAMTTNISDNPTFAKAMSCENKMEWTNAIQREHTELSEQGTWEPTPRPTNVRVLPCKLLLKTKRNADGMKDKFKERLVALGCLQRHEDYNETFSPVVDFTTARLALTLSHITGAEVHHLDVTGAFFYGKLDEELYMSQPKRFEAKGTKDHMCKLRKSIHGRKQAPRVWNQHLT
jgi:Reverse transcriptase (RNA-dependent DNA polymerase)